MHQSAPILLAMLAVILGGPVLLGIVGMLRSGKSPDASAPPRWHWAVSVQSALFHLLAFNITFFIQELFLVVPKALTPGLDPVLYHNNHNWSGDHPLENLFQGTGAAAILLSGLVFAWLARRRAGRSGAAAMFFFWMAYNGLFQAIPQFVIGAFVPSNDVGRAMTYFALGDGARIAIAIVATFAVPATALLLSRPLLDLAADRTEIATARARTRFAALMAMVPGLAAVPFILLYRVPRELPEVVMPPVVVTLVGTAWLLANAWRVRDARPAAAPPTGALLVPALLALVLLAIFQLVLRPGIPF